MHFYPPGTLPLSLAESDLATPLPSKIDPQKQALKVI